jgi:hypothetical protein
MKICKICEEHYKAGERHICPKIWIKKLMSKEIIIRTREGIDLVWEGNKIIVFPKEKFKLGVSLK